jgi:hypothetical protein
MKKFIFAAGESCSLERFSTAPNLMALKEA